MLGTLHNAIILKGYFPETARGLENERFAFVMLDVDNYEASLAGLEFFYPRLNHGGYMDDSRLQLSRIELRCVTSGR
jgi:hypothetical protein